MSRSARGDLVAPPLTARVVSALLLAPLVLLLLWLGPPWTDGLLLVAACIMMWEWARMCGARSLGWLEAVSVLTVAAAVGLGALQGILPALAVVALGTLLAGTAAALRRSQGPQDGSFGWFGLGVVYVGGSVLAFQWLRDLEAGRQVIFWLIFVVWATDIGAYAVGRALKGPKLWPAISPNKTWAGALGGLLAAVGVGLAFALATRTGPLGLIALASAGASLAAQVGDFFESFVKRRFHRKDSSALIPGHGGLLDRVDGLVGGTLAVALAAALREASL